MRLGSKAAGITGKGVGDTELDGPGFVLGWKVRKAALSRGAVLPPDICAALYNSQSSSPTCNLKDCSPDGQTAVQQGRPRLFPGDKVEHYPFRLPIRVT